MRCLPVAVLVLLTACARKPACEPRVLEAARAEKLTLDGKLDEPQWRRTPNTGPFSGTEIVTHTEVRALYDAQALYVGWYAADEDIGANDLLVAELNGRRFEVKPSSPGVDSDGTLDDPTDDDEEWTAELAIPWPKLGLDAPPKELTASFRRDDQPKGSHLRQQRWGGECGGVLRLRP